ncbi:MAG: methane monooxygenase/ammonia monooxygenase subunit C [Gammaproteobacteria bacterium]|nr:methane monooxygenase/ammonia monooxygenase subunit C [Gammaproteobacteria bacterium]
MAISVSTPTKTAKDYEFGLPWPMLISGFLLLAAIFGTYRWYMHAYAFEVGMDYFEPIFQTYWMNLLWAQIVFLAVALVGGLYFVWTTREKDVLNISPQLELQRYLLVFGFISVVAMVIVMAISSFAESDAAWHQVSIRDTDFTPTHIILFYFCVPTMIVGLALALVWVHTRLPDYHNRVSVPMIIMFTTPLMIMPNVGFNEWGHTFFYAEELFAAPIHYGFVVLLWGFFALSGFILQCLERIKILTSLKSTPVNAKTA